MEKGEKYGKTRKDKMRRQGKDINDKRKKKCK